MEKFLFVILIIAAIVAVLLAVAYIFSGKIGIIF